MVGSSGYGGISVWLSISRRLLLLRGELTNERSVSWKGKAGSPLLVAAAPWNRSQPPEPVRSGLETPAPGEGFTGSVRVPHEINSWKTFQGLSQTAERAYVRSAPQGKLLLPHDF